MLIDVPSPSWPKAFIPQQYASPPVVTPQVCARASNSTPALIEAKLRPPETSAGVLLSNWVPSPSWPKALPPQQYASPPVVTPHVWPPAALTEAKLSPPATLTGVVRFVLVPSPSTPKAFHPQQEATPPVVTPHV